MAQALSGGSGWVVLVYIPRDGHLVNQYASEHSQAIAGGIPILALDMYEHAYHMDFGANAKAYIESFMRNVDYAGVHARYEDAAKGLAAAAPRAAGVRRLPANGRGGPEGDGRQRPSPCRCSTRRRRISSRGARR
jgi:hypothetical protein